MVGVMMKMKTVDECKGDGGAGGGASAANVNFFFFFFCFLTTLVTLLTASIFAQEFEWKLLLLLLL